MADKFVVEVPVTITGGSYVSTSVAVRLPSNNQENQTVLNAGPGTVYLGQTSAVTSAVGSPFPPGSEMKLIRNGAPLWAIAGPASSATYVAPASLQVSAGVQAT